MARPKWDHYFMDIAYMAASRSTCPRKRVGAVLTSWGGSELLATGYNGSIRKGIHCDDAGCDVVDNHCVRTIHAEMNILAQAAYAGRSTSCTRIYTTCTPCWDCVRVCYNAGIDEYVYHEDYKELNPRIKELVDGDWITLDKLKDYTPPSR